MIYWLRNVTEVSSKIFMITYDYFLDAGKYFKDVYDRKDDASINIWFWLRLLSVLGGPSTQYQSVTLEGASQQTDTSSVRHPGIYLVAQKVDKR